MQLRDATQRRRTCAAFATAVVLASGCTTGRGPSSAGGAPAVGSAASTEDYDKVRALLSRQLAASTGVATATFDVTNQEIDCIAGQFEVSVTELTNPDAGQGVSDVDTKTYRCLTSTTMRQVITVLYTQGPAADQIEASGTDGSCMVDAIVTKFDQWRAGSEPYVSFVSTLTADAADIGLGCSK